MTQNESQQTSYVSTGIPSDTPYAQPQSQQSQVQQLQPQMQQPQQFQTQQQQYQSQIPQYQVQQPQVASNYTAQNQQAATWAAAPVTPAAPVAQITSSQKIGWFFVGVLIGVAGILIASLTNIDKPYRSECTKFAAIGLVVEVLFVFFMMAYGCAALMYSIY